MLTPPFYPARPVNGGAFDQAPAKHGAWFYEPKFNGWRATIHLPTGTMFNRKNQPMSIVKDFEIAISKLQEKLRPFAACDWVDVEGLERRHNIARGSLIVLDVPLLPGPLSKRRADMNTFGLITFGPEVVPDIPEEIFLTPSYHLTHAEAMQFYRSLADQNKHMGIPFYEGLVAKKADSIYPMQLRNAELDFPFWVKHRWAF